MGCAFSLSLPQRAASHTVRTTSWPPTGCARSHYTREGVGWLAATLIYSAAMSRSLTVDRPAVHADIYRLTFIIRRGPTGSSLKYMNNLRGVCCYYYSSYYIIHIYDEIWSTIICRRRRNAITRARRFTHFYWIV